MVIGSIVIEPLVIQYALKYLCERNKLQSFKIFQPLIYATT